MIYKKKLKIEFGDFQTPLDFAKQVCKVCLKNRIKPKTIIEPTCGTGNFIEAAIDCFNYYNKIIGFEINKDYLNIAYKKENIIKNRKRVELLQGDFFYINWKNVLYKQKEPLLIIGNFPWVTNATVSSIGGSNIPQKSNFLNHKGFDAITGKSNFDISEWMLIQVVDWFKLKRGAFAFLCKTQVARKILEYIHRNKVDMTNSEIYKIDAMKIFGAAVDACLFLCEFTDEEKKEDCKIFENILDDKPNIIIGYRDNFLLSNISAFENTKHLIGKTELKWRSGIKHDCSKVMEFSENDGVLFNGLGEIVDLEDKYIFPLLKGTDVGKGIVSKPQKKMLVTQHFVGEDTKLISKKAPKTWNYLLKHSLFFEKRGSSIYKNNPRFSIFGVGKYTFAPWKVAISSLHKKLSFHVVGPYKNMPVVFDDTVYFISFENKEEATVLCDLLNAEKAKEFFSSFIFWDSKRPIKTSILNKLDIEKLADLSGKKGKIKTFIKRNYKDKNKNFYYKTKSQFQLKPSNNK